MIFFKNLIQIDWTFLIQLIVVYHHTFLWVILPLISIWVPIYMLYTRLWWIICLYFIWFAYDFDTPRMGSRSWDWYKKSNIWKQFADYFPIRLIKTVELPPDRNYIMGCHPHGIFSVGAFVHLCTDGTGFSQLFPEIRSTILTLNGQFWFPFRREIGIALGAVESSRYSLSYLLRHSKKGQLVGIVIGGAEEVLDAHPGQHVLNIMGRRGFCRFALQTGAALVPSYSFGENDIYDQFPSNPRGSKIRTVQSFIRKKLGFCPPLFTGRGFFSEKFGIMPRKLPITTVVGEPILTKKTVNPTESEINLLHTRYCQSLVELFDRHKVMCGVPEHVQLKLF